MQHDDRSTPRHAARSVLAATLLAALVLAMCVATATPGLAASTGQEFSGTLSLPDEPFRLVTVPAPSEGALTATLDVPSGAADLYVLRPDGALVPGSGDPATATVPVGQLDPGGDVRVLVRGRSASATYELTVDAQPPAPALAAPAATALTAGARPAPVDLEPGTSPRLAWQVEGAPQVAYEVQVGTSPDLGAGALLLDTGPVDSVDQHVEGPVLPAAATLWWRVRITDEQGRTDGWSDAARIGSGPGQDWDAAPIWAPEEQAGWGDYELRFDVVVEANAFSPVFRATGTSDYYMWQFRAGADELAPHVKEGGGFRVLDTVPLPDGMDLDDGASHEVAITALGDEIVTVVDGVEVDRRTDATHPRGGVGFRNGRTEASVVSDLVVTASGGDVLLADDTGDGASAFACGTVEQDGVRFGLQAECVVGTGWGDYEVVADVTIQQTTASIVLRAQDTDNYLMWQLKTDGTLQPHVRVDGTFSRLGVVDLGRAIEPDTPYELRIRASGSTITTWLDGEQVDERTDTTFPTGVVGVRTGGFEAFSVLGLTATSLTGQELYASTFDAPEPRLSCGTVATAGVLTVGNGSNCILGSVPDDWAFLRGAFDVADVPVASAHLYVTATSTEPAHQYVHTTYLNGAFVGLGPTRPLADEARYDGFDVTDLVEPGTTNVVGALAYATQGKAYMAQLVVRHVDGTTATFGTGQQWTALRGGLAFPVGGDIGTQYYDAPTEDIVAASFPSGFATAGFDAAGWEAPAIRAALGELRATPTRKVEQQLHEPVAVDEVAPGHYVLDYGRTWVGGLQLALDGEPGQRVDIRYGEELAADGSVRYQLRTGNTYRDVWTLDGTPRQLSTWGMRVFRYVEVIGAPAGLGAGDLPAVAQVYPFDGTGTFASSDADLDTVYGFSRRTIESLNGNLYADSWTRERINYEADAYLQLRAHLALSTDSTLGQYSMDYFEDRRTWPTEWPLYVILGEHELWQRTGDIAGAAASWDDLVEKLPTQWVEASTGLVRKDSGSAGGNSRTDFDIVDWPSGERDGYVFRPYNTVVNAISYRAFADMAAMAEALGRDAEADEYGATAARLRDAINERMWDEQAGAYVDGLASDLTPVDHRAVQATVFPASLGVPATAEQAAAAATTIADRGIVCSTYCAAFLVESLFDGDRADAALGELTDDDLRSWRNMIDIGAGATMEAWDPSLKGNTTFSHPWGASPASTIPEGVLGVGPTSPGFRTFAVTPRPGGLTSARGTVPTPFGTVGVAVGRAGEELDLSLDVPSGTTATVALPALDSRTALLVDGIEVPASEVGGRLAVELGAGCHAVATSLDGHATPQGACEG